MTGRARQEPDMPQPGGLTRRLHFALGRSALFGKSFLRPAVSLGVRLAAFDASGRVFLVRHSYLPGWYLPGGGVGRGEHPLDAVCREAREEGALEFPQPPELASLHWRRINRLDDHIILFVAQDVRQPAPPGKSLEILESEFFDPSGLPEDTTGATRARLNEILQGLPPASAW